MFIRRERVLVGRHTRGLKRVGESGLMVVRITFMGHFFWISFSQSSCFSWL